LNSNKTIILALILIGSAALPSCRKEASLPQDARTAAADAACREKWGKGIDDLPEVELVVIGAHNENIQAEFRWAFSLWHAERFGQRVRFDWRDVGGGGSSIQTYLLNVYGAGGNPEIDVLWGGGEFPYIALAKGLPATGPLLEQLNLPPDVFANVPEEFSGSRMYDKDRRWIGSALSGFGFLYNRGMMEKCRLAPPEHWDDLADRRFDNLLELADPNQSGSAAAAYKMIIVSGEDWPGGWAKLMGVMGNARRFSDSAGSAANSPVLGESLVATCIDFYGAMRVAESPGQLTYVTPRGQTIFTPDPIAVLKNPPHRQLAERFVEFVMSPQGQSLWALRVGEQGGPVRSPLGRQPIRRDVYEMYSVNSRDDSESHRVAGILPAKTSENDKICEDKMSSPLAGETPATHACANSKMLPWIVNPYQAGQALELTGDQAKMNAALGKNFTLLRELIFASAVKNRDLLHAAHVKVMANPSRSDLTAEFNALPENISTLEQMSQTGARMKDPKEKDQILRDWEKIFADKYKRIIDSK